MYTCNALTPFFLGRVVVVEFCNHGNTEYERLAVCMHAQCAVIMYIVSVAFVM